MLQELKSLSPLAGYAGIAALGAAVAAFWGQIRGVIAWFTTWFISSTTINTEMAYILEWHLRSKWPELTKGRTTYTHRYMYIRPLSRWGTVALDRGGIGRVILYRWFIPVVISKEKEQGASSPEMVPQGEMATVSSIRWLFNTEKAIVDSMREHGEAMMKPVGEGEKDRHFVMRLDGSKDKEGMISAAGVSVNVRFDRRFLGYKTSELGNPTSESPFSHLAYPEDVTKAVEICRRWMKSKDWYESKHIPWRLGMLFTGPPGTGKTSCARAIAQLLDLPIFILDLTDMSNSTLVQAWARVRESSPAMVLLEDVDRVAMAQANDGKERREQMRDDGEGGYKFSKPLTLDCLLNCLSGVEPSDGIVTIATANDASKLDPALGISGADGGTSTRPGRLDFRVDFPPMTRDGRVVVAKKILGEVEPNAIDTIVDAGEGETGAQFTKRCADYALALYWNRKDGLHP